MYQKYFSFITIVALLPLLASCSIVGPASDTVSKNYEYTQATSGSLAGTARYVANAQGLISANLAPKAGGRIERIPYDEWSKVDTGDVLLSLDAAEAHTAKNAAQDMRNRLQTLSSNTSKVYDNQMELLEAKRQTANAAFSSARANYSGAIAGNADTQTIVQSKRSNAKLAVDTAQTSLETTKAVLTQREQNLYNSAENAITNSVIVAQKSLTFLDEVFGVSDNKDHLYKSERDSLSAQNTSLKTRAKEQIRSLLSRYASYKDIHDTKILNNSPKKEEMKPILLEGKALLKELEDALQVSYDAIDASASSRSLTEAQIDTWKQKVLGMGQDTEAALRSAQGDMLSGVAGVYDSIIAFEKEQTQKITALQKQQEQAQEQLESARAQGSGSITGTKTQREVARHELEKAKANRQELEKQKTLTAQEKEKTLSSIQTQMSQARANLENAQVQIQNSQIVAPFAGIIINKQAEKGEVIKAGAPVLALANDRTLKLIASVPYNRANSLSVQDTVPVFFEGISQSQTGSIHKIYPMRDETSKKTKIEVHVPNPDGLVSIGTLAEIGIPITGSKNVSPSSSVIIPRSALVSRFESPKVFVLQEHDETHYKAKLIDIKIQNQSNTQLQTKNLKPGDLIISQGKSHIYDGEVLRKHE